MIRTVLDHMLFRAWPRDKAAENVSNFINDNKDLVMERARFINECGVMADSMVVVDFAGVYTVALRSRAEAVDAEIIEPPSPEDIALPTQDDMVERLRRLWPYGDEPGVRDTTYVGGHELVLFLDFQHVQEFMTVDEALWNGTQKEHHRQSIITQIHQFMPHCWLTQREKDFKASDENTQRLIEWLWLAGETATSQFLETLNEPYRVANQFDPPEVNAGPALMTVCKHFGWDWDQWTTDKALAKAKKARPYFPTKREELFETTVGELVNLMDKLEVGMVQQLIRNPMTDKPEGVVVIVQGAVEASQTVEVMRALGTAWQEGANESTPALILPQSVNRA